MNGIDRFRLKTCDLDPDSLKLAADDHRLMTLLIPALCCWGKRVTHSSKRALTQVTVIRRLFGQAVHAVVTVLAG